MDGCDRRHHTRGFCAMHWQRFRRHGDPNVVLKAGSPWRESPDERMLRRFWAKVNKAGPTSAHAPELGPCWEWTGATNESGYGRFYLYDGTLVLAHRLAWYLTFGEWPPPDLDVCHRCDYRLCVRTSHHFLGTRAENNADMIAKGRLNLSGLEAHRREKARRST